MRLFVCSSSGPVIDGESPGLLMSGTAGGLVPMLVALLERSGGAWAFLPRANRTGWPDRARTATGTEIALRPIRPDPSAERRFYEDISVKVLLWLFHYLHETAESPVFDQTTDQAWQAYRHVNGLFADALRSFPADGDDDVVIVNDFHLLLVPGLYRRGSGRVGGHLVYLHHVPWCAADYFAILPAAIRRELLDSVLQCDVIGFHADRWAQAFLACCERFVPGVEIRDRIVHHAGGQSRVAVAPGALDIANLRALLHDPVTRQWHDRLKRRAGERTIVARAERFDLWKNVLRGFLAFESLLDRRPELAEAVCFYAVLSPVTAPTPRHIRYQQNCEAVVRRTNARHRKRGLDGPIVLLYPSAEAGTSRQRTVAALSLCQAALVNPTFDGLNLVAKEALLLNTQSSVLLSTNTGVYEQVAPFVTPVHPFDIEDTSTLLEAAIDGDLAPSARERAACQELLRSESADSWLAAILTTSDSRRQIRYAHGEPPRDAGVALPSSTV